MEGSNETFLFKGKLYKENIEWTEFRITNTVKVRGVALKLVSMIYELKEITTTYLLIACRNYRTDIANEGWITLGGVVATMISLAYGQVYDALFV